MDWTANDMPDLAGKIMVVTGANGGIGLEIAHALARKRAHVVMACRDLRKAEAAMAGIRATTPGASLELVALDLSSQASAKQAAAEIRARHARIDGLVNNAGIMWVHEGRTVDGFEQQTGTNHFGHFTFTGLLLPAMQDVPGSRIVTVSSLGHWAYRIYFDNIHLDGIYNKQRAYSQSKIANLAFALELDRRLRAAGAQTISVASHPGATSSDLAGTFARESTFGLGYIVRWAWPLVTQSTAAGAWPSLFAATAAGVKGGEYFGPRRLGLVGSPTRSHVRRLAADPETGRRLWELSERLTGMHYPTATNTGMN